MLFRDRRDAGHRLAERVAAVGARLGPQPVVLGLPRGGVPVAFEIATRLAAPLDVFVVRKVGVPGHEELAMGAVATGGVVVLNEELIRRLGISEGELRQCVQVELAEVERRQRAYRVGAPVPIGGRGAVLVDDGLATGATMLAAIRALRRLEPARITVAVPVASPEAHRDVGDAVDLLICVATPERFLGVGLWFDDFAQTSDEEVRQLLQRSRVEMPVELL